MLSLAAIQIISTFCRIFNYEELKECYTSKSELQLDPVTIHRYPMFEKSLTGFKYPQAKQEFFLFRGKEYVSQISYRPSFIHIYFVQCGLH